MVPRGRRPRGREQAAAGPAERRSGVPRNHFELLAEWTVLEQSAHLPHLEEPERFREVVEGFLDRVEGGAA